MARVSDRFRAMARKALEFAKTATSKAVQFAKKAGNWAFHLTPVTWAWDKAKFAGSKAWHWAHPGVQWANRMVVQPVAYGVGVALAVMMGSKLLAALTGLVLLGLVVTIVTRKNWRGKEKVVAIEVAPAPEEPKAPKKKSRKVAEEKVKEAVDAVFEALTDETEEVEVVVTKTSPEAPPVTEAPAEVEKTEDSSAAEPAKGNGYKVKLPEGDLIPTETLAKRFNDLDVLINAEMNKPDQDKEYICELQGRQNLIHVRAGKHSKVKKSATVAEIHEDFKKSLLLQWGSEHEVPIASSEESGIYPSALYRGAMAENSRLNKIIRLKAEHDRLKGSKVA